MKERLDVPVGEKLRQAYERAVDIVLLVAAIVLPFYLIAVW